MSVNSSNMKDQYNIISYLNKNFTEVDFDKDGVLSEAELSVFNYNLPEDGRVGGYTTSSLKAGMTDIIANNKELQFSSVDNTEASVTGLSKKDTKAIFNNLSKNKQSIADQSNNILSGFATLFDSTNMDPSNFKAVFDSYITDARTNYEMSPNFAISSDEELKKKIIETTSVSRLRNNFENIDSSKDNVLSEEELINYKNTFTSDKKNKDVVSGLDKIIENNKQLTFSSIDGNINGSILGLTVLDLFLTEMRGSTELDPQDIDAQANELQQKYAPTLGATDEKSFENAVGNLRKDYTENSGKISSESQAVYLPQETALINFLKNPDTFNQYDTNQDGSINQEELIKLQDYVGAETDQNIAAQKGDAAGMLYLGLPYLKYISDDSSSKSNDGLTQNDLNAISDVQTTSGAIFNNLIGDIDQKVSKIDTTEAFNFFDVNQDGIITSEEVSANTGNNNKVMEELKKYLLTKTNNGKDFFSTLDNDKSKGLSNTEFQNLNTLSGSPDQIMTAGKANLALYTMNQNIANKPDGVIGKFAQGGTGDCVFLAALIDINSTEQGKEVLSKIITDNGDNTYTVNFKGSSKPYTVTKAELDANKNLGNGGTYSNGDVDVKIMEIAADKWYMEKTGQSINSGINLQIASELLLGAKQGEQELDAENSMNYLKNYDNNRGNYIDTVYSNGHLYSLKDVDPAAKKVTLVNPHASDREEVWTFDEFVAKGGRVAMLPVIASGYSGDNASSAPVSAFGNIPTDIDTNDDNKVSTDEYLTYYNQKDADHNGQLTSNETKNLNGAETDKTIEASNKIQELKAYNTAKYQAAIKAHPDKAQELYNGKVAVESQLSTITTAKIDEYYTENAINTTADSGKGSRLDQVNDAYITFLGRPANQDEINDWVNGQYANQPIEYVTRAIVLAAQAEVKAGRTEGLDVDLINNKDNALIKMFYKMHGVDNVDQGSIDWANWNIAANGGETRYVLENFRVNNMNCSL